MFLFGHLVSSKVNMWQTQKIICLQILDDLEKLPIYQIFRGELKCHLPPKQNPDNYPPQVLNLAIIRDRIKDDTYQSLKDWNLDINLFFNTILRKSYIDELFKTAARYLNDQFQKKIRIFELRDQEIWEQKSSELKNQIDELLKQSPPIVQENLPRSFILKIGNAEFTNCEADYLTRCIRLIHDQSDLYRISTILKSDPTPLSLDKAEVSIDLRQLHKSTLCDLMVFFKNRFPEEPIKAKQLFPIPFQ